MRDPQRIVYFANDDLAFDSPAERDEHNDALELAVDEALADVEELLRAENARKGLSPSSPHYATCTDYIAEVRDRIEAVGAAVETGAVSVGMLCELAFARMRRDARRTATIVPFPQRTATRPLGAR